MAARSITKPNELVAYVVFVIAGCAILYFFLPRLWEFEQIRRGVTAPAVVDKVSIDNRSTRKTPRHEVNVRFHFDYQGSSYSSTRFNALSSEFSRAGDASDAAAAAVNGAAGTAYFDPKDPAGAVLELKVRPQALTYPGLGSALLTMGLVSLAIEFVRAIRNRWEVARIEPTERGIRIVPQRLSVDTTFLFVAFGAMMVGGIMLRAFLPAIEISPIFAWLALAGPLLLLGAALVLMKMLIRPDAMTLDFDDEDQVVRLVSKWRFGASYVKRCRYVSICDVVVSSLPLSKKDKFVPAFLFLPDSGGEALIRMEWLEGSATECDDLSLIMRKQVGLPPREEGTGVYAP